MGIIIGYVLPVFMVIGIFTSISQFAIKTTGNIICLSETAAESYTYETTTTDEFGNSQPATAVELHRVDQRGTVIKSDPIVYAFL